MVQAQPQSLPTDKFLTVAANLLHRAFLEPSRTDAKNIFRAVVEGDTVPITKVRLEDESIVRFDVALDHSEYRGKLNFGTFRNAVALLLARLAESLEQPQQITVFNSQGDANAIIFGVSAVTYTDSQANVLVLGADTGTAQGVTVLRLMYIDPQQFDQQTPGHIQV